MISSVCPEEIRALNRKHTHEEWWKLQVWLDLVARETAGKRCEYCDRREGDPYTNSEGEEKVTRLTLHHPESWSYDSLEIYLAEYTPREVICERCHTLIRMNLKVCPECKTNAISVMGHLCRDCEAKRNPKLADAASRADEDKRIRKNFRAGKSRRKKTYLRFPCAKRGTEQRCRRGTGMVCDKNARTAIKCPWFKQKVVKVTA